MHSIDLASFLVSKLLLKNSLTTIVFLISCGILKIGGMIFTPYGWGQKFTLNNPMEHLLDLFKFFWEAFEDLGSQFSPFFFKISALKEKVPLGP